MKSILLLENSKPEKSAFKAHHGLSIYVEWKGKKILFDTGQNSAFAKNARFLGIDLNEIDYCVISHAHYDHGGGLKYFFSHNSKAPVYLRPTCRNKYYARIVGSKYTYIGLDLRLLQKHEHRFHFVEDRCTPSPGVLLTGPTDFNTFRPNGNSRLFMHREGTYREDIFDHEMMMILHDEQELKLFTGCAHSGILNMIRTVEQEFPGKPVTAVIGGFHLMLPSKIRPGETEEAIRSVGEALARINVPDIYTGHCTGNGAYSILKPILGGRLKKMTTGLTM